MDQVRDAILFLIALILSITVHEFGHAWMATRLGDSLPRAQGRLTLSPISHIDPIGTLVLPLLMAFTSIPLLGWGRPVQTNPSAYTRRMTRSTGSMLVAVAGPAMNLVLAVLVSLALVAGARAGVVSHAVAETVIRHLVLLNISLMFFNLLPIPPLDGGAVLAWVLPRSMQGIIDVLNRWGFLILLGMLMVPGVLSVLMTPGRWVASAWIRLLVGGLGF